MIDKYINQNEYSSYKLNNSKTAVKPQQLGWYIFRTLTR